MTAPAFRLEPSPAFVPKPEGTRAHEDAWNRYVEAAVDLQGRVRGSRRSTAQEAAAAAYEAAGYTHTDAGAAFAADRWEAAASWAQRARTGELLEALERAKLELEELEEHRPGSERVPAALQDDTIRDRGPAGETVTRVRIAGMDRVSLLSRINAYARELEDRSGDLNRPQGERLILTMRKSARRCENRSVLIKCACGARLVDGGCARSDCVRCAPQRTRERARVIFDKLTASLDAQRLRAGKSGKDVRLWSLRVSVLTMPPELREQFVTADAWKKLRRRVWHLFRDEFNAEWCCITTHPVGDEDPTVFHPHLNVLWSKKGPGLGVMPADELERLRRRWGEVVGAGRPVDVHGSFVPRQDEKKLRHRARYYGRMFVAWGRWLRKAVQWYGAHVVGLAPRCKCVDCAGAFEIMAAGEPARRLYGYFASVAGISLTGPPVPSG